MKKQAERETGKKLEILLDAEIERFLAAARGLAEVSALVSGNLSRARYKKLLKTFCLVERISHSAVNTAAVRAADAGDSYLAGRLGSCAAGELGHAELAVEDLRDLGERNPEGNIPKSADAWKAELLSTAREFPAAIISHSYLFEGASGILFQDAAVPKGMPDRFVSVHAKEDPAHARAIRRTIRAMEKGLSAKQSESIVKFARKSGERMMRVFAEM